MRKKDKEKTVKMGLECERVTDVKSLLTASLLGC